MHTNHGRPWPPCLEIEDGEFIRVRIVHLNGKP
ncbi:hypothetical protein CsSME_00014326 [Camellia sinensis var. sinensis]